MLVFKKLFYDIDISYFACVHACMTWHTCGCQGTTCGSQFSPTRWVPGIELRPLGLAASTFITEPTCLPLMPFYFSPSETQSMVCLFPVSGNRHLAQSMAGPASSGSSQGSDGGRANESSCHEVGHSVPIPGGDWVSSELLFLSLRTGIRG